MKHYRQVIINIEVEDDLPEQKLEELVDKIKATVEENTDKKEIQLDGVRLNWYWREIYLRRCYCDWDLYNKYKAVFEE